MANRLAMRILLHLLAFAFNFMAIGLTVASLVTPAWQVVNITLIDSYHQHGLWVDCVYGRQHAAGMQTDYSSACSFKFDSIRHNEDQHNEHWEHTATLSMLCFSSVCAFIGLIMCSVAFCSRCSYAAWAVDLCICMVVSSTAVILYYVVSMEGTNRIVIILGHEYEQMFGYSFWFATASCGMFALAVAFAVAITVWVYIYPSEHLQSRGWVLVNEVDATSL